MTVSMLRCLCRFVLNECFKGMECFTAKKPTASEICLQSLLPTATLEAVSTWDSNREEDRSRREPARIKLREKGSAV